jgi:hypothetical protein
MDSDPRVKELNNLKFGLAEFALQLDAFEARLKARSPKITLRAFYPAPRNTGIVDKIVAAMKERANATCRFLKPG